MDEVKLLQGRECRKGILGPCATVGAQTTAQNPKAGLCALGFELGFMKARLRLGGAMLGRSQVRPTVDLGTVSRLLLVVAEALDEGQVRRERFHIGPCLRCERGLSSLPPRHIRLELDLSFRMTSPQRFRLEPMRRGCVGFDVP